MNKINEILEGWGNVIKDKFNMLDPDIKKLSTTRLYHCNKCPIRVKNSCSRQLSGISVKTKQIKHGCGCNIAAKTLSPSSKCPLEKWQ